MNEVKLLLKQIRRAGWRVEQRSGCHYKVFPPTGPIIVISATPNGKRGVKNARADCRRAGLDV